YHQLGSSNYARQVTEGLALTMARVGAEENALQAIDRLAGDFPDETSTALTLLRLRLLVGRELITNRTWQSVQFEVTGRATVKVFRHPLNEIIFTQSAEKGDSMPAGPVFMQAMYDNQIVNIGFVGDGVALAHKESYLQMMADGETAAAHETVYS